MKPELVRIKNDLDTMQKALGLAPSMGREWLHWMQRDKWFSLWRCVPGLVLIAAALLPLDPASRYWGLVADQGAGLLVAALMLSIAFIHTRRVTADDDRPEELIRESKRI